MKWFWSRRRKRPEEPFRPYWKGREASQNPPIHPVKRSARATVGPAHVEQIGLSIRNRYTFLELLHEFHGTESRRVYFCSALDLLVRWVFLVFPHLLYNLPYNIYWSMFSFIYLFAFICMCLLMCMSMFVCFFGVYMYNYVILWYIMCVYIYKCIYLYLCVCVYSWGTHYIVESECLYPSRFVSRCSPDTAGTDGLGTRCERCTATGFFDVFEARNADFTHSDYRWL